MGTTAHNEKLTALIGAKHVHVMLDQVIAWGGALKTLREKQAESTL